MSHAASLILVEFDGDFECSLSIGHGMSKKLWLRLHSRCGALAKLNPIAFGFQPNRLSRCDFFGSMINVQGVRVTFQWRIPHKTGGTERGRPGCVGRRPSRVLGGSTCGGLLARPPGRLSPEILDKTKKTLSAGWDCG